MWAHTTYGFESGNGDLLDVIHSAKGVHHQVCRHIGFKFSLLTMKQKIYKHCSASTRNYIDQVCDRNVQKTLKVSETRYFGKMYSVSEEWMTKLNNSKTAVSINKMVRNGCLHLLKKIVNKRSDNSFIKLIDGSYANIVEFIVDRENKKNVYFYNV